MLLVRAETRIAGVRIDCSGNTLLWHWMRFILTVRCCVLVLGFAQMEASAQLSPAAAKAPRPVIVAFGDSLTAGYGAEPGNSYTDFLQKDLDRAGFAWRVENAGVSGDTTTDGLHRLNEVLAAKARTANAAVSVDTTTDGLNRLNEVLAARPRIAIVEFGGNDGLRGLPIETTRVNLEQIVVALQNARTRVLLAGMTLPPNYGRAYIGSFEQIYEIGRAS